MMSATPLYTRIIVVHCMFDAGYILKQKKNTLRLFLIRAAKRERRQPLCAYNIFG